MAIQQSREDCFECRESLLKPRRKTSNAEHSKRASNLDWEPLFDVTTYCSLTSQRA